MIKLNGTELNFKTFPNGETLVDGDQLRSLVFIGFNKVVLKYESDNDLIKLMFVKKYLDDLMNSHTALKIYYMPYSRMDRVEGNSVFTLKFISHFINSLEFRSVEVVEPHSNVTLALLDRSFATYPSIQLLEKVIEEVEFDIVNDYLFFPDFGAQGRYKNVTGYRQLVGNKRRDFETGKILSLDVIGEVDTKNFKVIIVDDLSSYGNTFTRSAEKLKELGASEIYLLVGHAEESIYEGSVFDDDSLIDKVFTTDSIVSEEKNKKIKIHKIGEF